MKEIKLPEPKEPITPSKPQPQPDPIPEMTEVAPHEITIIEY